MDRILGLLVISKKKFSNVEKANLHYFSQITSRVMCGKLQFNHHQNEIMAVLDKECDLLQGIIDHCFLLRCIFELNKLNIKEKNPLILQQNIMQSAIDMLSVEACRLYIAYPYMFGSAGGKFIV
jgi:hypothetical protein